jgi:Cu/Ag efflux protein CusF
MHATGRCARLAATLLAAALRLLPLASLAAAPSRALVAQAQPGEPAGVFHGVGIVKAIDPASGALTLDHEAIRGLMPAMEMMYRVQSPAVIADLRVGDRVDFSLDGRSLTILDAKIIERAK